EGGALRVLVDERRRLERDRHTRGVLALDLAADLHLGRRVRAALVAAAVPVAVVTGAGAVAVAAVRSVAVAVPVRTGGGRLGGRVRVALVARAETAETDDEQAAPQRDHREDGEDLHARAGEHRPLRVRPVEGDRGRASLHLDEERHPVAGPEQRAVAADASLDLDRLP